MKTKLILVLSSAALFLTGCATSHSHAKAWDYKTIQCYVVDLEKKLKQAGEEGWLVVSSTSPSESSGVVVVILKRDK